MNRDVGQPTTMETERNQERKGKTKTRAKTKTKEQELNVEEEKYDETGAGEMKKWKPKD